MTDDNNIFISAFRYSGALNADARHLATADVDNRPVAADLVLTDGRRVLGRRATPHDGPALIALYEDLSAQSRYTRFCQATPRLTSRLQRSLSDLDRGPVWVAFQGLRCVGEARLVTASDGAQHLAMAVADDLQGSGLGRQLGRLLLTDPAARPGDIVVSIMAVNYRAARLARLAGFELQLDDGMLEGRLAA